MCRKFIDYTKSIPSKLIPIHHSPIILPFDVADRVINETSIIYSRFSVSPFLSLKRMSIADASYTYGLVLKARRRENTRQYKMKPTEVKRCILPYSVMIKLILISNRQTIARDKLNSAVSLLRARYSNLGQL
jgi:hypothetical protein